MRASLWRAINIGLLLFLPLPLFVVAAISVSPDPYLRFPPTSFSLVWYLEFLSSPEWLFALLVSTVLAAITALVSTAAAIGAVFALDRAPPRVKGVAEMLILAPLIFPHAAVGVAMLGLLTSVLYLRGTYLGIAIVHVILCGPFAYRPIAASFQKIDPDMVEAAMNLGAGTATAVRRVVLPLLRPGIVTSLLFTFILSFDEITVTLFLVGPGIKTLPLAIFSHLEQNADPVTAAISTLLILTTLILVIGLQRTVGLEMFVHPEAEEGQARSGKGH